MAEKSSFWKKIPDILLKALAFFVILEPAWMLLPFAGFLYGSVMHIEALSSNTSTAWLVYFIFHTHTLFPIGLILIALGFLIFLVGAFQIYSAKLFKKGMVKNGIYRWFRHPQYVALSVFCTGIILTWGRFTTYIAFFIMIWLYYYLSRSEERKCEALFGSEYEEYKKKTYFILPGEGIFIAIWNKIPFPKMPRFVTMILSFAIMVGIAIGSGLLIQRYRLETRESVPAITGKATPAGANQTPVELIMVKGPAMQAAPVVKVRDEYMDNVFKAINGSRKISELLKSLRPGKENTFLVFVCPGSDWHAGGMSGHKADKLNLFMVMLKTPVLYDGRNFQEFRASWDILKMIQISDFSSEKFTAGKEPVEGEIKASGPPFGAIPEKQQEKIEERIDFFLSGL
ncbi:MAG: isoprenylcysteine carboxylmethyltransferase family protein [Planctomycetes bacterium]|nr:isoprenylcysteine carboxylmethyltransferase family protein [Planctomycetota bacterium]